MLTEREKEIKYAAENTVWKSQHSAAVMVMELLSTIQQQREELKVKDQVIQHEHNGNKVLDTMLSQLREERDSFQRVGIKVQEVNVRLVEALEGIVLLCNEDGSPCDGFRFRELILEARKSLQVCKVNLGGVITKPGRSGTPLTK